MLNRALFDRITIDDEDDATLEPNEAIATIVASDPKPHNERTLPRDQAGQGSNVQLYVDLRGLEPLRCSLQRRCSATELQALAGPVPAITVVRCGTRASLLHRSCPMAPNSIQSDASGRRVHRRVRTGNLSGFNRALFHMSLEDVGAGAGFEPATSGV